MTGIRPQHIKVARGRVADKAIVVGDPARADYIAGNLLEDAILVNKNRGFTVYTGTYKGMDVTVAVHGVGGPSSAIVFEELHAHGARVIIRLGTTGGLIEDLDIGDFVVAAGAYYNPGGLIYQYFGGVCPASAPDPHLTVLLVEEAAKRGRTRLGYVFSSDAFYAEDPDLARRLSSLGVIAIEMEAATLFSLAGLRGFKAGALLVVSDNLVVPGKEELVPHERLVDYVHKAGEAVLEAMLRYKPIGSQPDGVL